MKRFKKDNLLTIRVDDVTMYSLNQLVEFLKMDKSDIVRMMINNGINYYQKKRFNKKLEDYRLARLGVKQED